MNSRVIVIDGKTYKDVNDMPPEVREKYEQAMRSLGDKDQNGVPDILDNILSDHAATSMKIVIDGKVFNGLENLPPEARARYEEAMGKLDANRNGIPDFVEGMINTSNQPAKISASFGMETPPRSSPLPIRATSTPDTSNGWMLVLAGLFLVALCVAAAGAVWYFFLR